MIFHLYWTTRLLAAASAPQDLVQSEKYYIKVYHKVYTRQSDNAKALKLENQAVCQLPH